MTPLLVTARTMISAPPGSPLAVEVVGDTDGDGLPELYLAGSQVDLLLAHPQRGGDAEALAVARLPAGHGPEQIAYAGDTDRDGYGDLWLGPRLFRGPLSGTYGRHDHDAIFETWLGRAVAGDFDADGDGWPDVAFAGSRQDLVVQYGPFEGRMAGYDRSDERLARGVTVTEAGEDCGEGVTRLRETLLVAGLATMPHCAGSLWAYDVSGPRGRRLSFGDARARFRASELEVMPDADGDGQADLLYLDQPLLHLGGDHPASTDESLPPVLRFTNAERLQATGDVTGDGLGDLLVQHHPPGDTAPSWYAVPGTVRGLDLDVRVHGVRLVTPASAPRWTWGDLDQDGLAELVAWQRTEQGEGRVWIYDGRDLAASRERP